MAAPAISVTIGATLTRPRIPVLCADLAELLRAHARGGGVVRCDVSAVLHPDMVTVEALARLRRTARQYGWALVVSGAGPDLRDLLDLCGLTEALPEAGR